jgi:cytochrome c556
MIVKALLISSLLVGSLLASGARAQDARRLVEFPPMMLEHEMRNMRDHLATLEKIQAALGAGQLDEAGKLAEHRLGLSSFGLHGAHEVAPYMPEAMQAIGTEMHKAASRFALETDKAAATGDLRPAIAALGKVTAQCVACHAAYRLH